MDFSPDVGATPQDSGCFSGSFDTSSSIVPSTPITHLPSRKRKHCDISESCPSSPQFSSTLNESLLLNFKEIHLERSLKIHSAPVTPEKQIKLAKDASKSVAPSPIEESRRILYSNIKQVKPQRKIGSPFVKRSQPLVELDSQKLLQRVLGNNLIMGVVFQYLSNGDLYRFSKVSQSFYKALRGDRVAFDRFQNYKDVFKDNKENYVITPPASPEKSNSPVHSSSENFNNFIKAARTLSRKQSLSKCRKCDQILVVENNVGQCQNFLSCGIIYCLLCSSFSEKGPEFFKDSCGNSQLRPKLANVSNTMEESFYNNILAFSDSGFHSENEVSPVKVRRNLFQTRNESPKVLSNHNRSQTIVQTRRKSAISVVEVVPIRSEKKEVVDTGSPPRLTYAACSKQSKRNLKRLTR